MEREQTEGLSRENSPDTTATPLFVRPPARDELPINLWAILGLVVLAAVAGVLFLGHHKQARPANTVLPLDPYAASLPISGMAMSESTSLSGGKSTFVDGRIRNVGDKTVTAITVQVLFRNDEAMPPGIETLPLALIRTHEPYVDTMPVSAAPLKPGDEREFRLIFETIPGNWNTQLPEIRIVQTAAK